MKPVNVVVWDNIGNTLLGVRPWQSWRTATKEKLIDEDPDAEAKAPDLWQLFAADGLSPNLTWLYDPARLSFDNLLADFSGQTQPLTDPSRLPDLLREAEILVVHKERLPPEAIAGASKLTAVLHLGQDYRGVPTAALKERGIPVAGPPRVHKLGRGEQVGAVIHNHPNPRPR
jgi:hypothetical protein